MCFTKDTAKLYDDLMQPLETENQDKSMWNNKCDYYNVDKCSNLNPEKLQSCSTTIKHLQHIGTPN